MVTFICDACVLQMLRNVSLLTEMQARISVDFRIMHALKLTAVPYKAEAEISKIENYTRGELL